MTIPLQSGKSVRVSPSSCSQLLIRPSPRSGLGRALLNVAVALIDSAVSLLDIQFAVSLLDIHPVPGTSDMRVSTEGNLELVSSPASSRPCCVRVSCTLSAWEVCLLTTSCVLKLDERVLRVLIVLSTTSCVRIGWKGVLRVLWMLFINIIMMSVLRLDERVYSTLNLCWYHPHQDDIPDGQGHDFPAWAIFDEDRNVDDDDDNINNIINIIDYWLLILMLMMALISKWSSNTACILLPWWW